MNKLIWKRYHKNCKNQDTESCPINSVCTGCYYYEDKLICSNCGRELISIQFKRKHGCPACVPEKPTKYCTGEY
jgi:hypothetical protein